MLLTVLYKTIAKKVEIFIERLATVATLQNWKKKKSWLGCTKMQEQNIS